MLIQCLYPCRSEIPSQRPDFARIVRELAAMANGLRPKRQRPVAADAAHPSGSTGTLAGAQHRNSDHSLHTLSGFAAALER